MCNAYRQYTHLIRKALTRMTKSTTNRHETMKLQSSEHPSNPHFGSVFGGNPFIHRIGVIRLKFGNSSSFDDDTNDPTCCMDFDPDVSLIYCIENTEKFPSALPFSSIKTYAKAFYYTIK